MKKKILLIIPAYNEEECILNTYKGILDYNDKSKITYDVIVVNDGSKDKTESILKENNIPHISLINNLGIGGAVQTGYKYALLNNYDIAVQYDADGQHNIAFVENIVKPVIDNKYDYVIGSRFIKKDKDNFLSTRSRRFGINLISKAIKLRTKKRIYDVTSGFRAVNKDIIKIFANNYPTEFPEPITNMILLKENKRYKEIPVKMNERAGGVSSIRSLKSIYFMINVLLSILFVSYKDGVINE